MLKDPPTFVRGIALGIAWLAWAVGGAVYASAHSPFSEFFKLMPQPTKMLVYAWVVVSTALLYYAIVFLIWGLVGRRDKI